MDHRGPGSNGGGILHIPQSSSETGKDNVISETSNSHPEICFSLKAKCSNWLSLPQRVIASRVRSGHLTHLRPILSFFLGIYSWNQALQAIQCWGLEVSIGETQRGRER